MGEGGEYVAFAEQADGRTKRRDEREGGEIRREKRRVLIAMEGRGGRCRQELEMKRFWDGKAPPVFEKAQNGKARRSSV